MIAPKSPAPFSSNVRIRLIVDGRILSVAKLGPERLMLKTPENLPPCTGEVVLSVDQEESRWLVRLPDGISADSPFVRTEQLSKPAA